jgi:hypothetical protein
MSRPLDLPDPVFDALTQAASASGTTPVGWIVAHLPPSEEAPAASPTQSMADLLAGYTGVISGAGDVDYSKSDGERFAEGMAQKRREGRL